MYNYFLLLGGCYVYCVLRKSTKSPLQVAMAMRYKSKLLLLFFLAALSPCTHPFQVEIVDRFLCALAGRSRFGSMDLLAFAQFARCTRCFRLVLSHCTCWSRLVLSCSSRCSKLHTKAS